MIEIAVETNIRDILIKVDPDKPVGDHMEQIATAAGYALSGFDNHLSFELDRVLDDGTCQLLDRTKTFAEQGVVDGDLCAFWIHASYI